MKLTRKQPKKAVKKEVARKPVAKKKPAAKKIAAKKRAQPKPVAINEHLPSSQTEPVEQATSGSFDNAYDAAERALEECQNEGTAFEGTGTVDNLDHEEIETGTDLEQHDLDHPPEEEK